jgi:SAM-dependent methyltransferase
MAAKPTPQCSRGLRQAIRNWASEHSVLARRILWDRGQHRSAFIDRYLDGLSGLEIGGSAHNDYGLDALNVDRFDSMETIYKEEEWRLCGRKRPVDVVAPGDELPLDDDAVDFVFASHVIEHFADPICALEEWLRVARKYVVLVVPHRDRTFDRERELTTISELISRREERATADHEAHWSVWTCESFLGLCSHLGLRIVDSLDPDDKVGNGFIVVLDAGCSPAG